MEHKTCLTCNTNKPLTAFYHCPSRNGNPNPKCIECYKTYHAKWYKLNRKKVLFRNKKRNRKVRELNRKLIKELKDVPCKDCKIKYPSYVMQFDHINEDNKVDGIAKMTGYANTQVILDEAAKCEVVCANCHAERTHKRRLALSGDSNDLQNHLSRDHNSGQSCAGID